MENIKIKKLENSQIEISGEVAWEKLEKHRKGVIEDLCKNLEISGFRKGHIPETVAINHIGETEIMNRSAERTLQDEYPQILNENKIEAIGKPFISITKLAVDNPLGFKIVTHVLPEVKLPNYKEIAKKINKKERGDKVTEKEKEEAIKTIREQWARFKKLEEEKTKGTKIPARHASQGEAGGDNEQVFMKQMKIEEKDLPEFNDDFVKKLSSEYKDVKDFEKRLEENIKNEKTARNREKNRIETMEEILEKTKIDIPEIMVESELQRMMFQFEEELKRANLDKKFYLANIKKTEEELKKEWREGAEKKSKIQLILDKIAIEEKLKTDEGKLKEEIEHLKKHHKNVDESRAREYIEGLMKNEEVMLFLEKQK